MAHQVFPESFETQDFQKTRETLEAIDRYIRYMCERIDFSISAVKQAATASGNYNIEVLDRLKSLEERLTGIQSQVNDSVNGLQNQVNALRGDIYSLQVNIDSLQRRLNEISYNGQTITIEAIVTDINDRLTALETTPSA